MRENGLKASRMSGKAPDPFSERVKHTIKLIPRGKVSTYGQIAVLAGIPNGARQVAWLLHSCSNTDALPWHRVINSRGGISLGRGSGYETQKALLCKEGVKFGADETVDLERYLWRPRREGGRFRLPGVRAARRRSRRKFLTS